MPWTHRDEVSGLGENGGLAGFLGHFTGIDSFVILLCWTRRTIKTWQRKVPPHASDIRIRIRIRQLMHSIKLMVLWPFSESPLRLHLRVPSQDKVFVIAVTTSHVQTVSLSQPLLLRWVHRPLSSKHTNVLSFQSWGSSSGTSWVAMSPSLQVLVSLNCIVIH